MQSLVLTWPMLLRPLQYQATRSTPKVLYSICGLGWGLAGTAALLYQPPLPVHRAGTNARGVVSGKLAEDSEAMRAAYGPARYLVSGLKSFVNLRGCPGTLKVLRPRPDVPKDVFKPCHFASICRVRSPLFLFLGPHVVVLVLVPACLCQYCAAPTYACSYCAARCTLEDTAGRMLWTPDCSSIRSAGTDCVGVLVLVVAALGYWY